MRPALINSQESLAKLRLLTLKALANSSPGLRFGNPGEQRISVLRRNSEGVASRVVNKNRRNSFRVATNLFRLLHPGFQSKPWAGISQRFQRKRKSHVLVNLVLLTTLSRRVLQEALNHNRINAGWFLYHSCGNRNKTDVTEKRRMLESIWHKAPFSLLISDIDFSIRRYRARFCIECL